MDGGAADQMLARGHRGRRNEVPSGIERRNHLARCVGGDESHAHRVEVASRDGHRLEARPRDGIGDLHHAARRVVANGEDFRTDLELRREGQLVAVGLGTDRDAGLPDRALLRLIAPGTDTARQNSIADRSVTAAPGIASAAPRLD